MSVTVLITAYKESASLHVALTEILPQAPHAEIMVVAPDQATQEVAQQFETVQVVKDQRQGKPAALNLGLQAAHGDIVVLTDGDVRLHDDGLRHLLAPFDDPQVGAVSGRPISDNPRSTMLGYWSHLLTDAGAHTERLQRDAAGQFLVCSGYLYAFRRELIDTIPEDALAEDAVVSHIIGQQGYRIRYAPQAMVHVRYPTTYTDWLKQKVRSAGGYTQSIISDSPLRMRSFRHEAAAGLRVLSYPQTAREWLWTVLLYLARVHLWLLIFWRVRVQNTPLTDLWQRVETTKDTADRV